MILDVTGIELIPGNNGADCPGNGKRIDEEGNSLQCCCDECDYMMCCYENQPECEECTDDSCPRIIERQHKKTLKSNCS